MKKIESTNEEKAFANIIYGKVEERAELTVGDNGVVLPESIVNKIIQKVYDICPIYQMSTRYNITGKVKVPYYDETTQSLNVAYATEFVVLESSTGKLLAIELNRFLAGVLTKVSKSLFNNSQFDVVDLVVNAMAKSISKWLENEVMNGTAEKISGLTTVTQKVTTISAIAVTADELIDLQDMILDEHQSTSIWIMNRATRKAIAKLKDAQGRYLLNPEYKSKWGHTLLGRDVYTTASISTMAAGKTAIYYGDMSGLAIKMPKKIEIKVLKEKYADEHAIGVISWVEVDSKVEDALKIAKLEMAAV
ncbi:MAG: phage major capsid protein [Peptostreptococcaceae bacterium]|nr:phage major capsid protein [Peptostreptococcaceae bacterium]